MNSFYLALLREVFHFDAARRQRDAEYIANLQRLTAYAEAWNDLYESEASMMLNGRAPTVAECEHLYALESREQEKRNV
jgi:hypothetical protein